MQNLQVLSHLKSGKTLTPIEALNEYGIFRLSARVFELKLEGWPIRCERITDPKTKKTYGQYSLELNTNCRPKFASRSN